ncbi:cytochrome [Klebsiella michiganensis]|uniref:cytochrome n=1 Tax=Klebsiella TaxID=570 RepID=UPI0027E1A7FF|nr:cytochrome [Klebsiella quasipneumoniae]MDQ6442867.1 cytochrome [Klebsiella quasipneumoniae]
MSFKFEEMIAALSPKREAVEVNGFKFYARPMTVSEFSEAFYQGKDKEDRNDIMIFNCVEHEDGSKVFETVEQVKSLFTTVRAQLAGAVTRASILTEKVNELEK